MSSANNRLRRPIPAETPNAAGIRAAFRKLKRHQAKNRRRKQKI